MIGHNGRYILVDKVPQIEPDLIKWAMWFEDIENRIIAQENVEKDVRVSTTFLGLDYSFSGSNVPILFETRIFGGRYDKYQQRYATWEAAEKGHKLAVQIAKGEIEPDGV